MTESILALSPLDGRYESKVNELNPIFSEFALIKERIGIEIKWLIALSQNANISELKPISDSDIKFLNDIYDNMDANDAIAVKNIERTTNHDVKAVEYFLKEKLSSRESLKQAKEFIHFACTSEDINNLSYGVMLKKGLKVLNEFQRDLIEQCACLSQLWANIPMLALTHGQPASPTTVGKEFANVVYRMNRLQNLLMQEEILGKINGAVGNFNAHEIAYPEVNWPELSREFIESLDLTYNPYTTQIEPHDCMASVCHRLAEINTVMIDLARDVWGYISLNFFNQKAVAGEVGSSTMPHKINPIDFENAEGNLGLANSMLEHFANKLPISRYQRDLSDSTVVRNIGSAFGYSLLAYKSLSKGLGKLAVNEASLRKTLDTSTEILSEAVQTVMRRYGIENPYEKLKEMTRGKKINQQQLKEFIQQLEIPEDAKQRLLSLKTEDYTGRASIMAKSIMEYLP